MDFLSLGLGVALLIAIYTEIGITALSSNGSGKLTDYLSRGIWKILFLLAGKDGRKGILNYSIILVIGGILVFWICTMWLGNYLVIRSDLNSVVDAQTLQAASEIDKLYFTGYTLSTLGNGEFKSNGPFWQLYSNILSLSGLIIITLSITYLLPILNSDIFKKKTSIMISSLGNSPEQIILNGWNGQDYKLLDTSFEKLADSIIEMSRSLQAYPVIHYSHTTDIKENLEVNIVLLDEAVTILHEYVENKEQGHLTPLMKLRKAINVFLEILDRDFIDYKDKEPNPRSFSILQKYNIPLKRDHFPDLSSRRKLLLGVLKDSGFKWEDIYGDKELTVKGEMEVDT
jgi:hypothetical protein